MVSESNGVLAPPQELETFLPQDGKKEQIVSKYKIAKDVENGGDFDPFGERKNDKPTSNTDTLVHLLKASLGTGILTMPKAFSNSGLVAGIFLTILVAVVCTHCSYILVKCAHVLYKKTRTTKMTFMEVAESALENGPQSLRKWAYTFRIFILATLFFTYFGTCSVYTVIVAQNIRAVIAQNIEMNGNLDERFFILFLLLPLILMSWVRNLKYLAPFSMLANILMGLGLGITFYYLVCDGTFEMENVKMITTPHLWPEFFSLTIFAMEAIGVVMPLENAMKTPQSMLGLCGVLNMGMSGVTMLYILLGFLGYLKYGAAVEPTITLSLDPTLIPSQVAQISIALAVFFTFSLQFFVCVEIVWDSIKAKFTKRPDLSEYIIRTILVTACVLLAVAVPNIVPLVGVIGAFCFSLLGLLAPAFIEIVTFWDIGFGPCKYLIWKNVLVVLFGLFALIFGTKLAVLSMINTAPVLAQNGTLPIVNS